MAVVTSDRGRRQAAPTQANFLYRPEVRQVIYQAVLVVLLVAFFYTLVHNTAANLRKQNIASGFDFVDRTAGFDVSQSLIAFDSSMTYGRAFLVGLLNTLLVAGLGIVVATYLGFVYRHRATLQQLADRPPRHGLRRSHSQRSRCCCSCSSGISPC